MIVGNLITYVGGPLDERQTILGALPPTLHAFVSGGEVEVYFLTKRDDRIFYMYAAISPWQYKDVLDKVTFIDLFELGED